MGLLRQKTGPGDTEVLVCPDAPGSGRSSGRRSSGDTTIVPAPEHTACHLRQAVGQAKRDGLREKLDLAMHRRQQFWMDTCRDALEMRVASRQVLELHRHYGCRFCVPAPRQVQYILDALDSALPRWDRDHPELFFRTLELNFPELVRLLRAPSKA